jgi:zinc D-Ala-D-Ala dipeptidase
MGVGVPAISRMSVAARRGARRLARATKQTSWAVLALLVVCTYSTAAQAPAPTPVAVQQRPAAFVDVATVVPGLIVDMRYAGAHNFVGRPIDGYAAPRCLLTRAAASALAAVAADVKSRGLVLKVFDCYRPTRAVADFVRWGHDLADQKMKAEFYPDVDKRTLFRNGYIASHSAHSRGSTLDLTLAKVDGQELDMGTPFDFFSLKSWPGNPAVGQTAYANRDMLASVMAEHGFRPYNREWWHFTLRHEPFPQTYFNFVVK